MQPLGCSLSSSFSSDICRFRCTVPYYILYEHTRGIVRTTHALNVWAASLKWLRCAALGLLACWLYTQVIAALCLCLHNIPALKGSPVVIEGRVGEQMYIVNSGRLQVWENNAKAPSRVKCSYNGVHFWGIVLDERHTAAATAAAGAGAGDSSSGGGGGGSSSGGSAVLNATDMIDLHGKEVSRRGRHCG
jgi:uncharacterized membrane protein YgcG